MARKKFIPRAGVINCGIFDVDILFIIGGEDLFLSDVLTSFGVEPSEPLLYSMRLDRCLGKTLFNEDTNKIIIRLKDYDDSSNWMGTTAHECMHAAHYLQRVVGQEVTVDVDETIAHSLGMFTRRIIDVARLNFNKPVPTIRNLDVLLWEGEDNKINHSFIEWGIGQ